MRIGTAGGRERDEAPRLALDAREAVEHAALVYLRWVGRPTDAENLASAATRIQALCGGRQVAREDLHVQLVMDELVSGLAAPGARRVA